MSGTRRAILLAAAAGALALALAALLARGGDPSPLDRLPDGIAVERDIPYGPGIHHRLDLASGRDRSRPRPAVVLIHPGGWMHGDKSTCHGLMAELAQAGYAAVSVNFRPSSEARFPAALRDCKLAVRWLRSHAAEHGVDPSRIGVAGWSSGAHLALLLALSGDAFENDGEPPGVSARVQAAVGFAGIYDFLLEEEGRFPNRADDPYVVAFLGGMPRENADVARRASPVSHLTRDDPPLLVFHGEQDRRIDVHQARRLAAALGTIGRSDEVVILPDEGHGSDVLPADARSRERALGFLARHLRPGE